MRGLDISSYTAPLDELFTAGPWETIAIGDGGNEIGMGVAPPRTDCAACRAWRDDRLRHPGAASDRGWGLELGRLCASRCARRALRGLARGDCSPVWTKQLDEAILEATVDHGPAVDGVSRRAGAMTVDNLDVGRASRQIAGDPRAGRGRAWRLASSSSKITVTTRQRSTLSLHYRFRDGPQFEEKLIFDFAPRQLSPAAEAVLDRIFRLIFLLSGVSYYKAFIPKSTDVARLLRSTQTRLDFCRNFTKKGLAEFAFRNGISLHGHFQIQSSPVPTAPPIALDLPRRTCVPVGGGKDSVVTLECLKAQRRAVVLFSLGDAEPIAACIAAAQLPFIRVHRRLDTGLFKLNEAGALNGHVPITGILSAIALACAVMSGFDAIAMSNEHSASAPNLDCRRRRGQSPVQQIFRIRSRISPTMSHAAFPRASPIFRCCGHCRKSRLPEDLRNTRNISVVFRSCNTAFRQSPRDARASLVLQLPEMPVCVPGARPVCRKAGTDRDLRP